MKRRTKKAMAIKPLEKKYLYDGGVCIPVPTTTQHWGNPLFKIELIRGRKGETEKGYYYIKNIIVGIPHLEKEGYTAWRMIECMTPHLALGNSLYEQGRWFHTGFCLEHGMPQIEVYPPKGATHLYLDHLFTSVSSSVEWEIPGVKEYSWRRTPASRRSKS